MESIRALFNEKEKELSMAVAKVEELTKQLEELRRGRISKDQTTSAAAQELEKLRRELAVSHLRSKNNLFQTRSNKLINFGKISNFLF